MDRFATRFGMHFLRSFREQLVRGVLAVLILALQLRYGLIRKAGAQGAWWSIIWSYLILVGLLMLGDLQLELRDFKLTYGKHLQRVVLDVPFARQKSNDGHCYSF
jgi:hypothetical protein